MLNVEIAGVSYRNDTAALCYLEYIASYLHEELAHKLKASPVLGWMMDESTSRINEKSYAIQMRMKKYDIRWLSLGGCIKSIIDNIYPGSQTLLTCLQQIALDANTCNLERKADQGLVNSILYDEFLYSVYMHHDSHEIVLRPLTTLMQCDHLSYFTLMEVLVEKENILSSWISESTLAIGSSLHQYIESTKSGSFCGLLLCANSSRCQYVVTEAFNMWSSKDHRGRFQDIQVLADVDDDDYQLMKLARSVVK
ncbi:unnamed protein product [Rotaria socialis]|uniref:Uncharacterized protein n=1 Tax=Rotaria socialis TaxID=392032 RepID=A0A820WSH4_9BILA|nr:unnamed protein product [Rotaria socialis]